MIETRVKPIGSGKLKNARYVFFKVYNTTIQRDQISPELQALANIGQKTEK